MRRRYETKDPSIHLGPIRINTALGKVYHQDREITLSPKELCLLEYMAVRRGRLVTRDALLEHLYAGHGDVASNVIDVVVCNLRKKIRTDEVPNPIETRRGFGYVVP